MFEQFSKGDQEIDQPGFDAVTFVGWGDIGSALKDADGADDKVDEADGLTAYPVRAQQNRSPAQSWDVRNLVLTDDSTKWIWSSAAKHSQTCLEEKAIIEWGLIWIQRLLIDSKKV